MAGDEYFDSKEFRDVLNEYEQSVKSGLSSYMDVDDLADVADYYHMHERYDEAGEVIELALRLHPGATPPLVYKIHEALSLGDVPAAEQYLTEIEDKSDLEYLFVRAEILIAQDRIDEAEQLFRQQFRDIEPDEHQDYVIDVANIYSDYNVHEKAMQWMSRAKPEDTDDFKELLARTMFGLGKYEESERLFNELIDSNPFSKHYWNALASAQFMKEDYSAAVTSSEYAIAIDPEDPEGILAKANGLYRLENFEEALAYFKRYGEKMPDDEFGLLHQGTCLINLNRFEAATQVLGQALQTAAQDSPYLVDIYQELAFAYSELHMPETALFYLEQTDELDCDHTDIKVIKGHVLLANGKMEESEEMFRQAISESGDSPKTLLRVLVSLYDNKYIHGAYSMFKKFFELVEPDWNEGYSYMALCCWDMKNEEEFMHYLRIATERNPKEARMVLGFLFPQNLKPEEYYDYMATRLRNQQEF